MKFNFIRKLYSGNIKIKYTKPYINFDKISSFLLIVGVVICIYILVN